MNRRSGSCSPTPYHLAKSPCLFRKIPVPDRVLHIKNSPSRTRTYDNAVNSRALYQLSYRGTGLPVPSEPHTGFPYGKPFSMHPHGQALDRLVTVSSECCHSSTPALSTPSSPGGLTCLRRGYPVLRGASRLDAFSVYPVRTWPPCRATG